MINVNLEILDILGVNDKVKDKYRYRGVKSTTIIIKDKFSMTGLGSCRTWKIACSGKYLTSIYLESRPNYIF